MRDLIDETHPLGSLAHGSGIGPIEVATQQEDESAQTYKPGFEDTGLT